jgi:DNA-binding CsgD family transcriptional regulator
VSENLDLLDVVEAAYLVEAPESQWIARLAQAARPLLDQGFGLAAFEFYRAPDGMPCVLQSHHLGIPEKLSALYPKVFATMDPEIRKRPFRMGPCVTGSQMMGMREEFLEQPHMKLHVQQFGMYDSIWITAAEPSGWGCGFHAGRRKLAWATAAETERWGRIAAHLSASVRLRQRLAGTRAAGGDASPEAVLGPNGKVHDASGPAKTERAREMLRRAVLELEHARGSLRRREPDRSLASWKGLVGGRWSLVDRLEQDGRRYILARQNEPASAGPDALTPREKQVIGYAKLGHHNKLIAYELGISASTVRVLLARAAAKLGVRTRIEVLNACPDVSPEVLARHGAGGARSQSPASR